MTQEAIHLSDYQPYPYLVEAVDLTFRLHPTQTRVQARLRLAPNPVRPGRHDLRLDGENLTLISAHVDGALVAALPDATGLTLPQGALPQGPFILDTEV
ncbi:MAG: aminopeptidase N, partial [Paracoccaceae bacterium]|nr:aminopeptidase N [Paracoccaceae bacterium]